MVLSKASGLSMSTTRMERAEEEAGAVAAIREPIKAEVEKAVAEGAATAAAAAMRERERMVIGYLESARDMIRWCLVLLMACSPP